LNTINPDEVVATGAAIQASLLTQDDFIEDSNITVQALNYDLLFLASDGQDEQPTVLIPQKCPIPVRRSHHLNLNNHELISVKIFLRSSSGELTELKEVGERTPCF